MNYYISRPWIQNITRSKQKACTSNDQHSLWLKICSKSNQITHFTNLQTNFCLIIHSKCAHQIFRFGKNSFRNIRIHDMWLQHFIQIFLTVLRAHKWLLSVSLIEYKYKEISLNVRIRHIPHRSTQNRTSEEAWPEDSLKIAWCCYYHYFFLGGKKRREFYKKQKEESRSEDKISSKMKEGKKHDAVIKHHSS